PRVPDPARLGLVGALPTPTRPPYPTAGVCCHDAFVRTTVTLDPDVAAALQKEVREQGMSFEEALNTLVRAGLANRRQDTPPCRTPARSLGLRLDIDLDKALRLSSELEDDEIIGKIQPRD
ncbi:hypothetical protein, partial [Candidatus Protofrankia datiscae]|uniref:hypothetical protein n=2 Tax=Frankiaceae TaxID=74712 RepID=UPI0019D31561